MSTTREHQQGFDRIRQTRLVRARRERELHQQRIAAGTDDLEHDRRREEELIEGTWQEQEAAYDDSYRF